MARIETPTLSLFKVAFPGEGLAPLVYFREEGDNGELHWVGAKDPDDAGLYHVVGVIPHYNSSWLNNVNRLVSDAYDITEAVRRKVQDVKLE